MHSRPQSPKFEVRCLAERKEPPTSGTTTASVRAAHAATEEGSVDTTTTTAASVNTAREIPMMKTTTTTTTPRGTSESSTTSDNTTEFIDIVKKYDVVYNTHNPDYKNVEVKMKVWSQIAEEIGLSVDASKRKWKNLRDSYTKYLRSFRIGTKTSKKYQYWAHADHMEFLKPYQGPGRTTNSNGRPNDDDLGDTESDLGYQVLAKATTSSEDDLKITITTTPPASNSSVSTAASMPATLTSPLANASVASASLATSTSSSSHPQSMMLPMPSLPTVQLPPQFIGKSGSMPALPALPPTSVSTQQMFSLPSMSGKNSSIPVPVSSTASSVGCLIIEPQLFAGADTFKKELGAPGLGMFHSVASTQGAPTTTTAKINPPLITKIRRVQPSQQTSAVNLSFTATPACSTSTAGAQTGGYQPPPTKTRKLCDIASKLELDVTAVLQANRDLDSNTLFFLSLAKAVRAMPTKFQSLAKMRCMRIVSDIELELENVSECNGPPPADDTNLDSPPDGSCMAPSTTTTNDGGTEHFVYVMSPSRVESMIDISSEDENTMNGI